MRTRSLVLALLGLCLLCLARAQPTDAVKGGGASRRLKQSATDPFGFGDFQPYSAGVQPGFVNIDVNRETGAHLSVGGVTVDKSADGNYMGVGVGDLFGFGVARDRGFDFQIGGGSIADVSLTRDGGLGVWILDGLININLGPNSASWIAEPIAAAGSINAQVTTAPISAFPIAPAGGVQPLPGNAIIPAAANTVYAAPGLRATPVPPPAAVTTASVGSQQQQQQQQPSVNIAVAPGTGLPQTAVIPAAAVTVYGSGSGLSPIVNGATGGSNWASIYSSGNQAGAVTVNAGQGSTGGSSSGSNNAWAVQGIADFPFQAAAGSPGKVTTSSLPNSVKPAAVKTPAPAVRSPSPAPAVRSPAPAKAATPAVRPPSPAPAKAATPAVRPPSPAPAKAATPAVKSPASATVKSPAPAAKTPTPAPVPCQGGTLVRTTGNKVLCKYKKQQVVGVTTTVVKTPSG